MQKSKEIEKQNTEKLEITTDDAHDIFTKQLSRHQTSKSQKTLNMMYSFIVGILISYALRKYTNVKYYKILGTIISLLSFWLAKTVSRHQNQNS